MIKRTIKETTTEYDKNGNVVRQTATETTEEDDRLYTPNPSWYTDDMAKPWWLFGPACQCDATNQVE